MKKPQALSTHKIKQIIEASIAVKTAITKDAALMGRLEEATKWLTRAFQSDHKVLFCGNGGSAADAQHLAAEFSGRFYKDRPPLYSEALHVNSSYLTAVANDYSYELVYERMVEAMVRKGDILVAISTSGNSSNIIKAIDKANTLGAKTIGMTGQDGGIMAGKVHLLLNVPSSDTPRIQESHILMGHILCQLVEENIF